MNITWLVPYYLAWHYTRGIKNVFSLFRTFVWFVLSFFSIGLLLKTLFAPFQRLQERYKGGVNIEDFFSVIIVNLMMRLVGFVVRTFFIILGLISLALTILFGIAFIFVWLFLPFIILYMCFASLIALFK